MRALKKHNQQQKAAPHQNPILLSQPNDLNKIPSQQITAVFSPVFFAVGLQKCRRALFL